MTDDRLETRLRTFREVADRFNEPGKFLLIQGEEVSDAFQLVIARIRIGVREKQKVINALELLASDAGRGGEIEHVLKADGRLLIRAVTFTDETWPHGVMKFGEGVRHSGVWFENVIAAPSGQRADL